MGRMMIWILGSVGVMVVTGFGGGSVPVVRLRRRPATHTKTVLFYGGGTNPPSRRQAEIRQKIRQLKQQGRLQKPVMDPEDDDNNNDNNESSMSAKDEAYATKIRQKLGDGKSKLLGFTTSTDQDDDMDEEDDDNLATQEDVITSTPLVGRLGSLDTPDEASTTVDTFTKDTSAPKQQSPLIDPSLFDTPGDDEEEVDEDVLVDQVAQKMMEKRAREQPQKQQKAAPTSTTTTTKTTTTTNTQLTSGVGGSWNPTNETQTVDMYQPKTGSWGAFPRPRDISKAYGGGRRVGPGYSNEEARLNSTEATRLRLKQYREKAGIEVQSEKDHAVEIDQALSIGGLAMQRGMYSTAVSALEKVTKYCSTNSKVGGKVFLELAMAYEAVGRTDEAITVYATLSKCRIEEIKFNAKRLLYGIEAMQFMRNEMKDSSFSRKKVRNTFIDTTGLGNIAQNFDDVYQTAYIDLEGNFYKRLTESVVRSPREARQILLKATDAGEVERTRIVQALRSLSRNFEDALEQEIERTTVQEPVAVMNGKPILSRVSQQSSENDFMGGAGDFVLANAPQMLENLEGDWRLQLLADRRGDGVKFFNSTLAWQRFGPLATTDRSSSTTSRRLFEAQTPVGFATLQVSGVVEFQTVQRILQRHDVETKGGGVFGALIVNPSMGPMGAVQGPHQIMMVDSTLLVTRKAPVKKSSSSSSAKKDAEKEYFAVWRRME